MALDFIEGRAVAELADGTVVSILNPDRNAVLNEARQFSIHEWALPNVQADEFSYEVSFRQRSTHDPAHTYTDPDYRPEGWERYEMDDEGDRIYGYVPRVIVEEYIEAHS